MRPDRRNLPLIHWVLRIGVVWEFLGHGALGIDRTAAWTSYFAVVGIHRDTALALMPWVGAFDVFLAAVVLFAPVRAAVLYMAYWGLWTAILRPLAGEPFWEAVERAGNYGAPLALFLVTAKGGGSRLHPRRVDELDNARTRRLGWVLGATTAMLLVGHGALGLLVAKPILHAEYASIGLGGPWVEPLVGAFECLLGLGVLVQPGFGLLAFVLVWKLATEALVPRLGYPVWVFIEHGGSYAAPLALAYLLRLRGEPEPLPLGRSAA